MCKPPARSLIIRDYDKCNCCPFDFLPGVAGGIYPDILQVISTTFLPFTNLVVWQATTSCFAVSSARCKCTLASEMRVASAMSLSDRSPCFFRYCRISFIVFHYLAVINLSLYERYEVESPPVVPPQSSLSGITMQAKCKTPIPTCGLSE